MLLSNGLKIDIEPLQKLRYCLTVPEIIAFPVTNEEFILETNVNYSFWAVLSQVQNDQERIVSYAVWLRSTQLLLLRHWQKIIRNKVPYRIFQTIQTR